MAYHPIVTAALNATEFQVTHAFAGLSGDQWDFKLTPASMTPAQMIAHLAECCVAAKEAIDGHPHEWGTYDASGMTPAEVMTDWKTRRDAIVEVIKGIENETLLVEVLDFVPLHEAYHVGQMVLVQLALNPDWNAYSIYRS